MHNHYMLTTVDEVREIRELFEWPLLPTLLPDFHSARIWTARQTLCHANHQATQPIAVETLNGSDGCLHAGADHVANLEIRRSVDDIHQGRQLQECGVVKAPRRPVLH